MSYDLFSSMDYSAGGVWWVSILGGLVILLVTSSWGPLMSLSVLGESFLSFVCGGLVGFLILLNLLGLWGCLFSVTTQFIFLLQVAVPVWLAINCSSFKWHFLKGISHFSPLGSPLGLSFPLSVIELVSSLIRPITLTLRLGMNITTGHIMLGLLAASSVAVSGKVAMGLGLLLLQAAYLSFEFGICIVQGVVFGLLVKEYGSEHT